MYRCPLLYPASNDIRRLGAKEPVQVVRVNILAGRNDSVELEEWSKSEWAKTWAAIEPPLGEVDLRPYVFATRDKRSYLGGLAAAGHLEVLVDRLMGPRLAVRALASEVAKLAGAEPEQVFDALAAAVRMTEDLAREPKGLQGLLLLVEHHAGLQRRLRSLLADLPSSKLGAWAVSNFGSVFKDAAISAEFDALVRSWAAQDNNSKLKTAASAMLKLGGSH